jgi:hypothetical protein
MNVSDRLYRKRLALLPFFEQFVVDALELRAMISSVKSLGDVRHVLKSLRDDDVTDDALGDLLEIDRELKRLLVGRDLAEVKAQLLGELGAFAEELKRLAA